MTTALRTAELAEWIGRLAMLDADVDDAERIRQVELLEALKGAAAAAQARVTVDLETSLTADLAASGVPAKRRRDGIAAQIALARRESPVHGARHLGLARVLTTELPHTLAALTEGRISEWRATLVVKASITLDEAGRRELDQRLAVRLDTMSDRQADAAARALAYELDPRAYVERASHAASERRVTMRPAPDTMAYLTALLPAKEAVAVFKALHDAAATARAVGDERSSDQVKADTLVQRVTGQASAAAVPLEIGVVITDTSLIGAPGHGSDHTAAHLEGYGPIPAADVRRWLNEPASRGAAVWVRRLFTDPVTDVVTTIDPKRRRFPCAIRDLVVARDQWCRTPWCGAPIRHTDHAKRWAGEARRHRTTRKGSANGATTPRRRSAGRRPRMPTRWVRPSSSPARRRAPFTDPSLHPLSPAGSADLGSCLTRASGPKSARARSGSGHSRLPQHEATEDFGGRQ